MASHVEQFWARFVTRSGFSVWYKAQTNMIDFDLDFGIWLD